MKPGLSLTIRADATPQIGAGHAMRMAALASAWRRAGQGPVRWVGAIGIPFVAEHLASLQILIDPPESGWAEPGVLVIDSHDEGARITGARAAGAAVRILVDDGGGPVPPGYQLVWWPAPFGTRQNYSEQGCEILTGPDFVPIREGLPSWSPAGSERIAVSLGGGQLPDGLASAMRLVGERVGRHAMLATGDWVPPTWQRIPADQLWSQAAQCERLIVAGGVSALEAAAVGIPVVVVAFTDNQQATLSWARAHGVPTVDVARLRDAAELVRALELGLTAARPLPALTDGSLRTALQFGDLARRVTA